MRTESQHFVLGTSGAILGRARGAHGEQEVALPVPALQACLMLSHFLWAAAEDRAPKAREEKQITIWKIFPLSSAVFLLCQRFLLCKNKKKKSFICQDFYLSHMKAYRFLHISKRLKNRNERVLSV